MPNEDEIKELKPMMFFGPDRATPEGMKDWSPKIVPEDVPQDVEQDKPKEPLKLVESVNDDENPKGTNDPSPDAPDEEPSKGDGAPPKEEAPEMPEPDLPGAQSGPGRR